MKAILIYYVMTLSNVVSVTTNSIQFEDMYSCRKALEELINMETANTRVKASCVKNKFE
jgi:hypothetical protein